MAMTRRGLPQIVRSVDDRESAHTRYLLVMKGICR